MKIATKTISNFEFNEAEKKVITNFIDLANKMGEFCEKLDIHCVECPFNSFCGESLSTDRIEKEINNCSRNMEIIKETK